MTPMKPKQNAARPIKGATQCVLVSTVQPYQKSEAGTMRPLISVSHIGNLSSGTGS